MVVSQPNRVQTTCLTLVFLINPKYILSVGAGVPIDRESSVVTSSISRPELPAQYLGGSHRGRVSVCVLDCIYT